MHFLYDVVLLPFPIGLNALEYLCKDSAVAISASSHDFNCTLNSEFTPSLVALVVDLELPRLPANLTLDRSPWSPALCNARPERLAWPKSREDSRVVRNSQLRDRLVDAPRLNKDFRLRSRVRMETSVQ